MSGGQPPLSEARQGASSTFPMPSLRSSLSNTSAVTRIAYLSRSVSDQCTLACRCPKTSMVGASVTRLSGFGSCSLLGSRELRRQSAAPEMAPELAQRLRPVAGHDGNGARHRIQTLTGFLHLQGELW